MFPFLPEKTYVASCSSKDTTSKLNLRHRNSDQRTVNNYAWSIKNYLIPHLKSPLVSYEVTLVLRQSTADSSVSIGLNEAGVMYPSYGKHFTGQFFKSLSVVFTSATPLSKTEKTNLQNNFHELLARFFIQRPTSLSNWEFNAEYNKDRRFREEDIVASMINFPNIVIQFA